ncbi:FecR family protein [Pseudorhodoferax sp.]|uniref:FecR family protein n=1 Tax=Pseudorhodoferax sp. TaxID=1993553 RepID=UPI002DD62F43|nr:FecR domain-containing protein [Pseudorhodoferax sp.]
MKKLLFLLCALLSVASSGAWAQVAGYVKTVSGQASIVSAGTTTPARPGMPLTIGDVVQTGADGSLGLTLKDNTMLSFGPSTTFTLEDFLFAPAQGRLQLGGSIGAGSLHYVSGAIARLKPDAVKIKTPTGVIGVRGTRFVAVVQP